MSRFLNDMAREIARLDLNVLRIAEVRRGGEAEEMTLRPCGVCQNGYSVAKAFTAAAVGLAYDRGLIDPADHIADILRRFMPAHYDERWEDMTIDHLLRHRPGFPSGYLDIDVADLNPVTGGDYLAFLFNTTLSFAPGAEYRYSDAAYYLLSRAVTERTGCALDDFLWRELLLPLGFREMAFSHCPQGYAMGATGLYTGSADTAKLARLYMDGGLWRGRRQLSKAWIDLSLEREYGFNRSGADGFAKGGKNGQLLMGLPDQDRAVAWHSFDAGDMKPLIDWVHAYRD